MGPSECSATDLWTFDTRAADAACEFFERYLVHTKGEFARKRFVLDDWQRDTVIRPLFGWKSVATGKRRYRRTWIEVPRKNGKSTLTAGIGLLLLIGDAEPGAEIYSAAADRDQASIVFTEASRMVAMSPDLSKVCELYKRAIIVPELGASYKVLTSDAGTKHGLNPHGILFDEMHTQPNRDLYDTLRTATGARAQSLEVYITTAGDSRTSIAYELHKHALQVRAGVVEEDTFLPVIYGADQEDDWTDPKVWAKANPSLGKTIKIGTLREECEHAQLVPSYQNTFRRLYLNQWVEQSTRWLPMDRWDASAGEVTWQALPDLLEGRRCFGALDLSTTTDITALGLVFPPEDEGEPWHALVELFAPAENIKRRGDRDGVPYPEWARIGALTATEGNVVDYGVVRAAVAKAAERYRLQKLAFDRWNSSHLVNELTEDGVPMEAFGQGFASMSAPSKEFEKLVVSAQLAHGGHPVLRWMANNVASKTDPAGNIKPAKDKSGDRIDGIVAVIMAIGMSIEGAPAETVVEYRPGQMFA
jgi:phage terminase large subunit-like protein